MKKTFFIFVLVGLIVGGWYFGQPYFMPKEESVVVPSVTPTPEPVTISEAKSIDGEMTFIMRKQPISEQIVNYNFFVNTGEEEYSIYEVNAKPNAYSVPKNSWSPDGRHVFFVDTAVTSPQIFIFNASGDSFRDGQDSLNVTDLFTQRFPDMKISEATGWDSRGLLHIRSLTNDGSKGPSFWFDVDSRSFIQLAAR